MKHRNDILGLFVNHRVAPNLLMVMMILAGIIALKKLNVQFFPTFALDTIDRNVRYRCDWQARRARARDVASGSRVLKSAPNPVVIP